MSDTITTTITYSPYKAAKKVNELLKELGIEKILPPQMFYNYTTARINSNKNPLIPCVVTPQGVMIEEDELVVWVTKYITKNHS